MTASIDPAATAAQRRRELLRRMAAQQGLTGSQYRAIPARGEAEGELSFAQQEIWLYEQVMPGTALFNVPTVIRLSGPLDRTALEGALDAARLRHSVLRATFGIRDGRPWQRIVPWRPAPLPAADVRDEPLDQREARALELARREISRPFDLTAGPLMRGLLIRIAQDQHLLTLTMHHAVGDALSWEILLAEITTQYARRTDGGPGEVAALPVEYGDYASWQLQGVAAGETAADLSYWRQRLTPAPEPADLPADRPRPARAEFRGGICRFTVPAAVTQRLRALALAERTTPHAVALAAFCVLLHRYSGKPDITVGVPVACRDHPDVESLVGHFVNTVLVRATISEWATFRRLAGEVAAESAAAFAHRGLPFERLVAELRPARSADRTPLFQVMFSLRPARLTWQFRDLRAAVVPLHNGTAKRDLTVLMLDHDGELTAELEYNCELFEHATIERLGRHFQALLDALTADPDRQIAASSMLEPGDSAALREANSAVVNIPAGRIEELFQAVARGTPQATAVRFGDQRLSYRELDAAASGLAARLRDLGIGAGHTVGICLERTPQTVIAVLAVLMAGAAFVPVEPRDPLARRAGILRGAGVRAVITGTATDGAEPESSWSEAGLPRPTVQVTPAAPVSSAAPAVVPEPAAAPRASTPSTAEAAYVLYTSGSTGRPKGVVVEHRQALAYVFAVLARLEISTPLRYLMVQPLTVDSCLTMLLTALLTGGELHLVNRVDALDASYLGRYVRDNAIDVLKIAPSHLRALSAAPGFADLLPRELLIIGGEASAWAWIREVQALAPDCGVHGHYGPTETTIGVLTARVDGYPADGFVTTPLGRALPGSQAWILDDYAQLRPPGVAGELFIGGAQVARGYLGQPGLTAAAFVPDPFGQPGDRLYRTGDMARYRPDGTIEFLGRLDDQVKISGFRVELGEIDAAIEAHPGVAQAVTAIHGRSQLRSEIIGYVVLADPQLDAGTLTEFLRDSLPSHMIPAELVFLTEMPLSAHGKINRRALPAPQSRPSAGPAAPPASDQERRVAAIWRHVLGTEAAPDSTDVHQNFFEAGGYSLLLIALHAELELEFACRVELIDLFTATTIAAQAALLAAGGVAAVGTDTSQSPQQAGAQRGAQQAEAMRRQRQRMRTERASHE